MRNVLGNETRLGVRRSRDFIRTKTFFYFVSKRKCQLEIIKFCWCLKQRNVVVRKNCGHNTLTKKSNDNNDNNNSYNGKDDDDDDGDDGDDDNKTSEIIFTT